MKYLDLFAGYGGFSLGIQQAYEELNKNSNDTGKGQKTSEQQGVSILSDDGGFQRKEVFTNGKCKNTAEAGVGGFYKQRTKLDGNSFNAVEQRRCGQAESELETTLPLPVSESLLGQHPSCIGFSEIDKYATQVYKKHFNHKEYGDIKTIDPSKLPDFDLLCGGFPCQAFSIAGKRMGFEDTRGTLIYEVFRILKEKHPRLVLLENVKGLLSHDNGRTFKTIITSLAELGYAVEWQVLNAKNFGVPQNRERVFIIGHLGGFGGRQIFPITSSNGNDTRKVGKGLSATITRDYYKGLCGSNRQGIINRTVRSGGRASITPKHAWDIVRSEDAKIRRLTPTECERLMGLPDSWTEGVSDTQRYKLCGNGVVVNVVKEIIKRLI